MVAVTAESVHDPTRSGHSTVFVTNYCLKYGYDAYIQHRQRHRDMVVLAQEVTADGSIAFQLSKKI